MLFEALAWIFFLRAEEYRLDKNNYFLNIVSKPLFFFMKPRETQDEATQSTSQVVAVYSRLFSRSVLDILVLFVEHHKHFIRWCNHAELRTVPGRNYGYVCYCETNRTNYGCHRSGGNTALKKSICSWTYSSEKWGKDSRYLIYGGTSHSSCSSSSRNTASTVLHHVVNHVDHVENWREFISVRAIVWDVSYG